MSPQQHLINAQRVARLMDSQFKFGPWRFGLDPILGLIPGGGDLLSLALASYIVWIAIQMKIPTIRIIQMIFNLALDFIVGIIPFFGDAFDFFYKPSLKNLEILRKYSNVIPTEVEGSKQR